MTMYLSNTDIRPTGYEPAEFIEPPTIGPVANPFPGATEVDGEDDQDVDQDVDMRVP